MKTPLKILLVLLFAASIPSSSGCCAHLRPEKLFGSRERLEEGALEKSDKTASSSSDAEIETLFQIEGKARRVTTSPDSKRILLERAASPDDDVLPDASSPSRDSDEDLNVELWNLEFPTAEQEEFREDELVLTLQKTNCAAFSAKGDRLFWLEREPSYDEPPKDENAIRSANFFSGAAAPSFQLRNAVLTREFQTSSFETKEESDVEPTPQKSEVKHLKTDDEIKTTTRVRISSAARWLIYRSLQNESNAQTEASTPETSEDDLLCDLPSWRLVNVADRKRVVCFPDVVKMTFDSSTSDETIEGRVVEILDVSDKGDLVATLVEELPREKKNGETPPCGAGSGTQNWSPRCKIVVWDLEVARTVDLSKTRGPFRALEVSQIPLKYPIKSRDCRFSDDGKVLAAKIEPRSISVWQAANGRLKGEFWEDDGYIRDFALASNGMRLVAGVGNKEGELLLWDVRTCVLQENLRFPQTDSIDAVAFVDSDERVLFVDSDGAVKRWNVESASGFAASKSR